MRFVIKEKFWSWGDDFHIYDPEKRPVYFVDGKAFSWGDQLSFQDMDGHQLAYISQRLFSWKPKYEIFIGDQKFAEVVKEWSWLKKKFTLDVPGPNDYIIDGSFWQHEYTFTRKGKTVAWISKSHWSWSHTYGIEIADSENAIPILCAAIVIDQVLHDEKK